MKYNYNFVIHASIHAGVKNRADNIGDLTLDNIEDCQVDNPNRMRDRRHGT